MPMWIVFFSCMILVVLLLAFHLSAELGSVDKRVTAFTDAIKDYYDQPASTQSDQSGG